MKNPKIIIVGYCIVVLLAVSIVPWELRMNRESFSGKISHGYHFIFNPPTGLSTIDYGKVALEIIAITCIAVLLYIMCDKLKK